MDCLSTNSAYSRDYKVDKLPWNEWIPYEKRDLMAKKHIINETFNLKKKEPTYE